MIAIVVLLCMDLASPRLSVPSWGYIALALAVLTAGLLRLAVHSAQ